jgi:HTH-type transcriptional regulator/antitoxin MqsA
MRLGGLLSAMKSGGITTDGGGYPMFRCHVCGATKAHTELVDEVFLIDGRFVLVENIPATVCDHCGEATYSRETTEKVRRMVQGEAQFTKTVPLDVFAFS